MQQQEAGNLVTENRFNDAVEEHNRLMEERNPETIAKLNEMMVECRKLSNTLLGNFPPEGFLKGAIDSLYLAGGFVGLALAFFGAGRTEEKFLNDKSNEVDEEINSTEAIYEELHGSNVAKIKMIRMFLIALMLKMDKLGNLLIDYDAQVKLGKARTELDKALIYLEQATYSISYVLTRPKPTLIQATGGIPI